MMNPILNPILKLALEHLHNSAARNTDTGLSAARRAAVEPDPVKAMSEARFALNCLSAEAMRTGRRDDDAADALRDALSDQITAAVCAEIAAEMRVAGVLA